MTDLLSKISGQFGKSLILGAFAPASIFVALSLVLVFPLLPADATPVRFLDMLDVQWRVLATTTIVIVLTILLYNLNIPLIRLYEGYPWERTILGSLRARHYVEKYHVSQTRLNGVNALLREMGKATDPEKQSVVADCANVREIRAVLKVRGINPTAPNQVDEKWNSIVSSVESFRMALMLDSTLPRAEELILPTKLGNVIRRFEEYPATEYNIDAVNLWPRLLASINPEYAAAIDDAKTSLDFMLNCSLLSAMLAITILFAGLLFPTWQGVPYRLWLEIGEILVLLSVAVLFYRMSVSRAGEWGEMVKSAFDLHRWDLLKKLGYERPIASRADERQLWEGISQQIIYGVTASDSALTYMEPRTLVRTERKGVTFELTRGVREQSATGALEIVLRVRRVDQIPDPVGTMTIHDSPPGGFVLRWGSAVVSRGTLSVAGINPYEFQLGQLNLAAEEDVVLTYGVLRWDDGKSGEDT